MKKVSLKELGKLSGYIFHGSAAFSDRLAPNQPTRIDRATGRRIADGAPCVAATPYLNLAVFRSIINPTNVKIVHRSSFGLTDEGKTHFAVSEGVRDYVRAHDVHGYVYALPKKLFVPYSPKEVRSSKSVKPEYYAITSNQDLPTNIDDERI